MSANRQAGNVLIMILVAVALFAALSYAIMQGSRTSTGWVSDTALKGHIDGLFSYANSIQSAVTRLKLRGCTNEQINFKTPSGDFTNPNSPADGRCDIFSTAGGGIQWKTPETALLDTTKSSYTDNGYGIFFFTGRVRVMGIGSDCTSASCSELLFELPHLTQKACETINSMLGVVPNPDLNVSVNGHTFGSGTKFTGTYTFSSAGATSTFGDTETWLIGKDAACVYHSGAPVAGYPYIFYKVLIKR